MFELMVLGLCCYGLHLTAKAQGFCGVMDWFAHILAGHLKK